MTSTRMSTKTASEQSVTEDSFNLSSDVTTLLHETLELILSDDKIGSELDDFVASLSTTPFGNWIDKNPEEALYVVRTSCSSFLRNNWTGPPSVPANNVLHPFHDRAIQFLGRFESVYHLCRVPEHLVLASAILDVMDQRTSSDRMLLIQHLKVHWMHQRVLDEKSAILYKKLTNLLQRINFSDGDDLHAVEFFLLACQIDLFYGDYAGADVYLQRAKARCGHSSLLTGIMGKRTKFQDTNYAQLVVELHREGNDIARKPVSNTNNSDKNHRDFPVDVVLDDDTLLKEAQLVMEQPHQYLPDHEAAVLLVEGLVNQRKRAKTNLEDDELHAYLQIVLQSTMCCSIRTCALFHRSRLEGDKARKTTRAMQQLETLMMAFRNSEVPFPARSSLALAVNLPTSWQIEEALGFLLLQNGCTKEAINIFTSLELWEDVIECYQRIGQKVKAKDLIIKELAKSESPSMWCRLGDISEDGACYDKAWDLSNCRSARSRRDLGRLLLKRQDYQGAAAALRQGLEVNGIDAGAWFSLGYCDMKLGEFDRAEYSFKRCVNLDPDHALAWNNLGSIALRNKDYVKAYRILQDSIKADYDNWNVWDNYQNACQRVKDFEEEIKACYRLLELRGKLNVESLSLLVMAVTDGIPDIHGNSASRLLGKVKELFGAMSSKLADNSRLWFLYAKLNVTELAHVTEHNARKELLQSIVQKLQRAFRYATKEKDWEKEDSSLIPCMTVALELGKHQQMLMALEQNDEEIRSIRSSSRVMLDSVISMVEKSRKDFVSGTLLLSDDALKLMNEIRTLRSQL